MAADHQQERLHGACGKEPHGHGCLAGRPRLIYDRNGELLAKNTLAYSLEITPDKVSDLEKTIDALSEIIPITTADRRRFVRLREDLNRYDSIPIRQELTDEEVAVFTGQQWRFPGVEINQREYRVYPEGSVAATSSATSAPCPSPTRSA